MKNVSEIKILFELEDDDPYIGILNQKGYREDVTVILDGRSFKVNFYYPQRLVQEIEMWLTHKRDDYVIEGHVVLQDELDNESIRKRIRELLAVGYFKE